MQKTTENSKGKDKIAQKITVTAFFTAVSLIMFMVENLFPPLFVPGAKAGLSNIPTLFLLYTAGLPYALSVLVIRITLGCFFSGTVSTLIYSLPAGIISLLSAFLLKKTKCSVMAVSAFSAVLHNLLQNTAFILVSATPGMATYYPYLALAGIPAGMIVGAAVTLLLGSERLMRALPFKTENRVRQEEKT